MMSEEMGRDTRRSFLMTGMAASAIAAGSVWMAGDETVRQGGMADAAKKEHQAGRLLARPEGPKGDHPIGLSRLGLDADRDGLLYVPAGYRPDRPAPLAVMLHGAGGNAEHGIGLLQRLADDAGVILLAPISRRATWDVIHQGFGPDVASIDRALEQTFGRYAVDDQRLAIGGFSDGASYALSLGLTNGDLFTHVLAFSPGFMAPGKAMGKPRLFLSHGTEDRVLPVGCSRRIVPQVKQAGYDVTYREFDGPHTVPDEVAREAMRWFLPAGARR